MTASPLATRWVTVEPLSTNVMVTLSFLGIGVFMYEMGRQVGKACDIPVASFDGDQADPRNFSEAQYDTRVQGLMEIMEANKEQKGAN